MKTLIVCGLLGAGKTTFIQNVAKRLTGKVVALVNDFGETGIDGEIVSSGGIESIELPSGCVCCSLKSDLITTLKKISEELSPEYLLIEPSGIASPSGVIEVVDMLGLSPVSVVGIVDATEFAELYEVQVYGSFFEDQIRSADVVLVNKSDLAGEDKIADAVHIIETLNPGAMVFRTVRAAFNEDLPDFSTAARTAKRADSHLSFDTVSFKLSGPVDYCRFKTFFEGIAKGKFGSVARAKALVRTDRGPFKFDVVYGKEEDAPFAGDIKDSRLVVIGANIDRNSLLSAAFGAP
jgi:G3E family GTPase